MIELGEHKQSVHGVIRMHSLDRQDYWRMKGYSKIILSHFGEFSIDFISDISERIESYMISAGDSKAVIKRMFTILIEGMKNVRQHGLKDERERQLGFLVIAQSAERYMLEVANLVDPNSYEDLKLYIDKINNLSEEELLAKYDESLDREFNNLSGAGLGMMISRLKTGNKIEIDKLDLSNNLLLCSFAVALDRR